MGIAGKYLTKLEAADKDKHSSLRWSRNNYNPKLFMIPAQHQFNVNLIVDALAYQAGEILMKILTQWSES